MYLKPMGIQITFLKYKFAKKYYVNLDGISTTKGLQNQSQANDCAFFFVCTILYNIFIYLFPIVLLESKLEVVSHFPAKLATIHGFHGYGLVDKC